MQIDRLKKHLFDSSNVDGDIIEFGIYKGTTFSHLIDFATSHDKTAYGIESFIGLPAPTKEDRTSNNTITHQKGKFKADEKLVRVQLNRKHPNGSYVIYSGSVPDVLANLPDTTYSFAVIDLINYKPTKEALEYIWSRMSFAGTLYFDNFIQAENHGCTKAIKEFIDSHKDEVNVSRQMMINGIREKELAIKCLRKEVRPSDWSDEKLFQRPITFAMVLKTGGGIYDSRYVNNLVEGIKSNISYPHKVVCLTDNSKGFTNQIDDVVKLKHNWPTWWSKIELFRPDLFKNEQVFYFDLDTIITGTLNDIVSYNGEFCALRDFYHLSTMGSGIMSWHGNKMLRVYDAFKNNPIHNMKKFQVAGDQQFISYYKSSLNYFQDIFPNEIVSYKVHCKQKLPKQAKIVCFHGNPRPHEVTGELGKYWKK